MMEVLGSAVFGFLILAYICELHVGAKLKSIRNWFAVRFSGKNLFVQKLSVNDENF